MVTQITNSVIYVLPPYCVRIGTDLMQCSAISISDFYLCVVEGEEL